MEQHVKAAVIGGGPAGIACGITLQKQGVGNCVIDRAVFPRNKTCAGLVTNKTLRELETVLSRRRSDLTDLFCDAVTEVSAFDQSSLLCHTVCDTEFHIADRFHFDNALATFYKDLGGTLLEGQRQYKIDYEGRHISLEGGGSVRYEYLVFADGALSRAHKDFSIRRASMAFCVEALLPREHLPVNGLELYLGLVPKGYVWVFPHGDRACAGLINLHSREFPYRETLAAFLDAKGVSSGNVRYLGAFVPYGKTVDQGSLPENVLLVGDAGGFVDPITGEGLYLTLLSGRLAGEALSAEAPKRAFLEAMQPAEHMIRSGRRLQSVVYSERLQKKVIEKMRGKNGILKFYCDNQISEYRYSHADPRLLTGYRKSRTKQQS